MAHFKISIPGNIHADVYKGKVFKKSFSLLNFWRGRKVRDESTGYVAIVSASDKNKTEYYLLKTKAGTWMDVEGEPSVSKKINGKWCAMRDEYTTLAIKQAIDEFENNKSESDEGKQ